MRTSNTKSSRVLSRLALASVLGVASLSMVWAAPKPPAHEQGQVCMEHMLYLLGPVGGDKSSLANDHMWARMQKNLERMSARLVIRASQQPAWQAFVNARTSMLDKPAPLPDQADAVAIAQYRAARAADRAQSLPPSAMRRPN